MLADQDVLTSLGIWAQEAWETPAPQGDTPPDAAIFADMRQRSLAIRYPLLDGTSVIGVLVVVFDLDNLIERFVTPLEEGRFGASIVLASDGSVVYDKVTENIGRNVFDGLHEGFPELLRLDEKLLSQSSGMDEYDLRGQPGGQAKRMLVAWNSVDLGDASIVIALSSPDAHIAEALSELRLQYVLAGIIVAVAMVMLGILVLRLRHTDLRVAADELQRQVDLRTSRAGSQRDQVPGIGRGLDPGHHHPERRQISLFESAFADIHGYENPDDVMALESIDDTVAEDDRDKLHDLQRRFVLTHETGAYEYQGLRKDGSTVWLEARNSTVPWEGEDAMQCIVADITERKRAEQELISANVNWNRPTRRSRIFCRA